MENKLTVNYATAWLMGVDPAATGARLKQYRNANHLTQEGLSGILTDGGDPASRVSISMWESRQKTANSVAPGVPAGAVRLHARRADLYLPAVRKGGRRRGSARRFLL